MRISTSNYANDLALKPGTNSRKMVLERFGNICSKAFVLAVFLFSTIGVQAQNPCDGLKCNSQVNLSLDQNCTTTITPGMFLQEMNAPPGDYVLQVFDAHGNPEDLDFGIEDVGETFEVRVIQPACNNNTCWSYMTVEYKLPPSLDCPPDLTISCGGFDVLGLPPATAACGGLDFSVTLFNEVRERLDCDPDYTHRITRTYRATDEMGNFSECTHTVLLERVDLSNIMFPENRSISTGNPISCTDTSFIFNANGVPLPWLYSSITGSGSGFVGSGTSGVPFICDPSITDGVFCPATGSGSGAPLIPMGGASDINFADGNPFLVPGEVNQVCNSVVLYTDLELPGTGCVKKIMRTWEVREWWCNGENTTGAVQLIEVVDDEAPSFDCPDDITVTTNDNCAGSVLLPSVDAADGCGNGTIVSIDYPNGFLNANGGEAELEVGQNIVTYIVNDECYNSSTCNVTVTVRDDTEPVTICEQNTVVAISQTGNTLVFAEVFDDGSWDECGLDRFEVARMDTACVASDTLFDDSVTFCCADIGQDVMVVFRAYDLGGNFNECMVNVEVQDKDIPNMICPADMTIDCRQPYDLENLGLVFGDETVVDNCAAQQVVIEVVDADVNSCGIGQITRQFQLTTLDSSQVLRKCTQVITVSNYTPFVASNIQWPLDFDTTGVICNYSIDPDDLPELYAYPIFLAGDDECSLLGWDYEDQVFESPDGVGECAYIERTWSVINWCSQVNGQFEVFTIPQPQIIQVFDNNPPSFDPADDVTIESFNIDCESGTISITRTATDDCPNLRFSYEVRNALDQIVAVGDSSTYVDTLLNGNYVIDWTVSDGCGNRDIDTQNLTIINVKAPIPICLSGVNVELETESTQNGDVEQAILWAEDFDGGSYHPCGNPITFSMSGDTTQKNIIFDCSDVGSNTIQMWVTDVITGIQDFCTLTVIVTDNEGNCPDNNMVDVSGEVFTEMLEQVEGVEVDLEGGELTDMTDYTGIYAFANMPMGGNYTIVPHKDGDDLNGVSTLDLILIQRHILGIEKLKSPYKLIAADIDKNNKISALDLIELRKLILGIHDSYPSNESWRFVDAAANFVDPQDPWAFTIPESYEIWELEQDMHVDFVGVKIGDVNNTVIANSSVKSDTDLDAAPLKLNFPEFTARKGEVLKIDVSSDNYTGITGWQGTLKFDPDRIDILDIHGAALDISSDEDINWMNTALGQLSMSYAQERAQDFNENEILFTIEIQAREDISASSVFSMGSDITKAEAYRGLQTVIPFRTAERDMGDLVIKSVNPNPWIDNAEIVFDLPVQDDVRFEFYDVAGRVLFTEVRQYAEGQHAYAIRKSDIRSTGLIYVRVTTSYSETEYKMMVID